MYWRGWMQGFDKAAGKKMPVFLFGPVLLAPAAGFLGVLKQESFVLLGSVPAACAGSTGSTPFCRRPSG